VLIYATATDLVANGWVSQPQLPGNVNALLRQASNMVRFACRTDRYYTYPLNEGDPVPSSAPAGMDAGKPSNPLYSQAMNDAVCQQVAFWVEAVINPDAGLAGLAPVVTTQTVPGGSVTYEVAMTQEWQQEAVEGLCEAAIVILRNAGLTGNRPNLM
jgi:hypothetical protein